MLPAGRSREKEKPVPPPDLWMRAACLMASKMSSMESSTGSTKQAELAEGLPGVREGGELGRNSRLVIISKTRAPCRKHRRPGRGACPRRRWRLPPARRVLHGLHRFALAVTDEVAPFEHGDRILGKFHDLVHSSRAVFEINTIYCSTRKDKVNLLCEF